MTICSRTGIALPECSCPQCTEELLRRFRPDLLGAEERVTRIRNDRQGRSSRGRRVA